MCKPEALTSAVAWQLPPEGGGPPSGSSGRALIARYICVVHDVLACERVWERVWEGWAGGGPGLHKRAVARLACVLGEDGDWGKVCAAPCSPPASHGSWPAARHARDHPNPPPARYIVRADMGGTRKEARLLLFLGGRGEALANPISQQCVVCSQWSHCGAPEAHEARTGTKSLMYSLAGFFLFSCPGLRCVVSHSSWHFYACICVCRLAYVCVHVCLCLHNRG